MVAFETLTPGMVVEFDYISLQSGEPEHRIGKVKTTKISSCHSLQMVTTFDEKAVDYRSFRYDRMSNIRVLNDAPQVTVLN